MYRMEQTSEFQPQSYVDSFQARFVKIMSRIKRWYEAQVASDSEESRNMAQNCTTGLNEMCIGNTPNSFDYLDEAYWQELMRDINWMPIQQASE
jgi:hypothetical protein